MDLQDAVREIHIIDEQLWGLESKYGVLSEMSFQKSDPR